MCKGMYITCVSHNDESEGYPVNSYRTKEEALAHIQYQREFGNKNNYWTIPSYQRYGVDQSR